MRVRNGFTAFLACGFLLVAAGGFYAQSIEEHDRDLAPTGRGIGTRYRPGMPADHFGPERFAGSRHKSGNGISYHGGPLIINGVNVYYIWYGNWSGNSATTLLTSLASHIGGSPYFNINTTYYNGSSQHLANLVRYSGATTDNYSHGTSLNDSSVQAVVSGAIGSGKLPLDPEGVYFVLTSQDVNETSGFCTQYCGWHTNDASLDGQDIKYAFIGNPARCPSACEEQTTSPNGNAGADGMASIIAHELEEATTDPDLNAWYDSRGEENADKCAWTFGQTSTASNGSQYNVVLGGTEFLIQQNWVNASGGYCAMSY